MDIINVAAKIEEKIKLLEKGRLLLDERAQAKANAIAEYEKSLAKTAMLLKNSDDPIVFDGVTFHKLPVTLIPQAAKGICYQNKINMDLAESRYKIAIEGLRCIEAELNGYQSIFRHLDEK